MATAAGESESTVTTTTQETTTIETTTSNAESAPSTVTFVQQEAGLLVTKELVGETFHVPANLGARNAILDRYRDKGM